MNRQEKKYCIITPCRNESEHLAETIHTVCNQSILPTLWVIVDDGSSDSTPDLLDKACRKYSFIKIIRREDRGERSVGPGVIDAFYSGLDAINLYDFEYICKLDADLELPERYFERLMEEMDSDPRLGTVSGKVFIRDESDHEYHEVRGDENSVGPSKFYRVKAFQDIGGFARHVGWDGVDGHQCRANGWLARSIMCDELKLIHRRQMGSSDRGIYRGRFRGGLGLWFIGNSFIYVLARSIARLKERPYIIGSMCTLLGYIHAFIKQHEQYGNTAYRKEVRRFERRVLLHGKRHTLEVYTEEIQTRQNRVSKMEKVNV